MATDTCPGYAPYKSAVPAEHQPQVDIALALTEATGAKIDVQYDPRTFYKDDRAASGHLYVVWPASDLVDEDIGVAWIDDRSETPLEVQLATELRRWAAYYRKIALKLEKGARAAAVKGGAE